MRISIGNAMRVTMLGSAIFVCSPATGQNLPSTHYTVIPAFQIDLERERIVLPIADRVVGRPLSDCSDYDRFCLDSSELRMAWKTQCGVQGQVGDIVSTGTTKARIVGIYDRQIHHSGISQHEFIFMVDGQEHLAYIVNPKAEVRSFLIDQSGEGHLASYFADNRAFRLTDLDSSALEGVIFSDVISSSKLGECRED